MPEATDTSTTVVLALEPDAYEAAIPQLAALIVDAVEGGAGVNFLRGVQADDAAGWWRTRSAGIADGTSNTIMVGEKQMDLSQFGTNTDDNEPYHRPGWNGDFDVYRFAQASGSTWLTPAPDYSAPGVNTQSSRFGSSPPGSAGLVAGVSESFLRLSFRTSPPVLGALSAAMSEL